MRLAALIALLLLPGALYGDVNLRFEPAWPDSTDTVTIKVTYRAYPLCFEPFLLVRDDRISVEIPCDGPIHLEGGADDKSRPIFRTFEVDPLAPGVYAVEVATNSPVGPLNERRVVASRPMTVRDPRIDILDISIFPFAPGVDDDVTIEVTTGCGTVLGAPTIAGRNVLVRGHVEPSQGPDTPCAGPPVAHRLDAGRLPLGEHSVLVLADGEGSAETGHLFAVRDFRIGPVFVADVVPGTANGRFVVSARWTLGDGTSGQALGAPFDDDAFDGRVDESVSFYFFRRGNRELIVKVLAGCRVNGFFWVFAGGLTDVGVELTVVDLVADRTKTYTSPFGQPFGPILDTRAFACD